MGRTWSNLLWFCIIYGAKAACSSFNINYPPMRTSLCPGDVITYTCALSSNLATVNTWWTGSGFQCSNPVNTIVLTQIANTSLNNVSVSCGSSISAAMTNISGTCYSSVLTISTPQSFNGTTVTCKDGTFGTTIGSDTLNVQMTTPPSTPSITLSNSKFFSNESTVTWTSVSTATSYNVSINGSTPISLPANATTYTFTGLANNTVYIVSVVAINCAGNNTTTRSFTRASALPSSSLPLPGATTSIVESTQSSAVEASSTPVPTTGPSVKPSSNTAAVGIGVGVGLGILIVLVIVVVLVIILVCKKGLSKVHSNKNVLPLPPKDDEAPPKPEGLIYADIGLPAKLPLQAPDCPELSSVTYSSVQH